MARRRRSGTATGRQTSSPRPPVGGAASARAAAALERGFAVPAAILAVVCLAAYWNSFRGEFLLDSQTIILKDTRLRADAWQALHDIFTHHYWWPFLESRLFRPLTTASYWFNYSVLGNGPNPAGYHAVNLLLHWANAVLAWSLVRAITGRQWVALFAAAAFASHPLTVESVTNVVGRADLLATLSVLGGLWLYRRFLASEGSVWWLIPLGLTYLAGVFCKESAIVLPAVMLLHDVAFPTPPRQWLTRAWPAYLAVAPGLLALFSVRWILFRHSPLAGEFGSDNLIAIAPFWTGAMTAIKVAGYYLALVAWPARLSCDYSYNAVTLFGWSATSSQDLHAWLALAALGGLAVALALAWRRQRAAFFFAAFAAATFLPTSNFLVPIGAIMAERFMYLPLIGLTAAGALTVAATGRWALNHTTANARVTLRIGFTAAALIVVSATTLRTTIRNEDWTSAGRLWSASAQAAPDSIKVIRGLAAATMDADPSGGRVEDALAILSRGLRILDDAPLPLYHQPAAFYDDLGRLYLVRAHNLAAGGEPARAKDAASQAVAMLERAEAIDQEVNRQGRRRRVDRGVSPAAVHDMVTGSIYRNLGAAHLAAGDPARALVPLSYLQRVQPDNAESHYGVGIAEGAMADLDGARGRHPESRAHFDASAVALIEAVLLNPSHDGAWQALRHVYGLLAPSSDAMRVADGKPTLNLDHPLVALHLRQARVQLERQLREAGMDAAVAHWEAGAPAAHSGQDR